MRAEWVPRVLQCSAAELTVALRCLLLGLPVPCSVAMGIPDGLQGSDDPLTVHVV